MLKILHTADWHLGKWLDNVSRMSEQKEVLEEICEIAERENVNAVLIAGDLFDTFNPSAEAQELFFRTLKRLGNNGKRAVIAIAGNHDQPDRIEAPDHLARECGIIFLGYPSSKISTCDNEGGLCITKSEEGFIELKLQQCEIPLRVIATPYANEFRLKTYLGEESSEEELRNILQTRWQQLANKYCDDRGINILCTHLFFQIKGNLVPEEPEDEKPILYVGGTQAIYSENIPKQIQYVAVGHLHRYQIIDVNPCPIVYSSSPLAYSFAEAGQEKNVVIIEAELNQTLQFRKYPLLTGKRLLRQRFENIDDAVLWLNENQSALVELTIVTEEFLPSTVRKRLNDAHSYIINIIPEIKNKTFILNQQGNIDLNKSIEQLFTDYFHHSKGQSPDEAIIELFKEVLSTE
jgi:exonuclease SbcD